MSTKRHKPSGRLGVAFVAVAFMGLLLGCSGAVVYKVRDFTAQSTALERANPQVEKIRYGKAVSCLGLRAGLSAPTLHHEGRREWGGSFTAWLSIENASDTAYRLPMARLAIVPLKAKGAKAPGDGEAASLSLEIKEWPMDRLDLTAEEKEQGYWAIPPNSTRRCTLAGKVDYLVKKGYLDFTLVPEASGEELGYRFHFD